MPNQGLGNLPVYINATYVFMQGSLYQRNVVFAIPKDLDSLSILQTEKQFSLLKGNLGLIVLCMPQIATYNRKRLIEKGVNFIVPGKQLFLPDLLIDLRESDLGENIRRKAPALLPSAQFLVIYHLIHKEKKWRLEGQPFKAIAEKTGYTATAITKAIDNLKYEEIVDVSGEKEKYIRFRLERSELWHDLLGRKLFINPVLKKVYMDEKPHKPFMLMAGASALPEYSDMNPSRQVNYATDRTTFYELQESGRLVNLNEQEGKFGLEVWKYDPLKLVGELPIDKPVVDPLSLYLSLQGHTDERIEMALDQIIEQHI
jgi:phosphoribosylformylglycinamidine (FGAM) synthase PurS component